MEFIPLRCTPSDPKLWGKNVRLAALCVRSASKSSSATFPPTRLCTSFCSVRPGLRLEPCTAAGKGRRFRFVDLGPSAERPARARSSCAGDAQRLSVSPQTRRLLQRKQQNSSRQAALLRFFLWFFSFLVNVCFGLLKIEFLFLFLQVSSCTSSGKPGRTTTGADLWMTLAASS